MEATFWIKAFFLGGGGFAYFYEMLINFEAIKSTILFVLGVAWILSRIGRSEQARRGEKIANDEKQWELQQKKEKANLEKQAALLAKTLDEKLKK